MPWHWVAVGVKWVALGVNWVALGVKWVALGEKCWNSTNCHEISTLFTPTRCGSWWKFGLSFFGMWHLVETLDLVFF